MPVSAVCMRAGGGGPAYHRPIRTVQVSWRGEGGGAGRSIYSLGPPIFGVGLQTDWILPIRVSLMSTTPHDAERSEIEPQFVSVGREVHK